MAKAFFLETPSGKRFCLYYAPDPSKPCSEAVLYVPPFGEEMNKSRRMATLQARSLAHQGCAVLLMDLYGCGDSAGELRNASWDRWKDDLATACTWLSAQTQSQVSLIGLRLGALLALDFLRERNFPVRKLVMWQPVLSGKQFLSQFFRLRLASDMLSGRNDESGGSAAIRQMFLDGQIVEIAGYEMPPQLALAIDALNPVDWQAPTCPLDWIEIQADADAELPFARKKFADQWITQGLDLRLTQLSCPEFWASQEIAMASELIERTTQIMTTAHK
jgi:exosortase A-associated hydrolase 2